MLQLLKVLASLKLTLVGMLLLGIGAALSYDNPVDTSIWVLVVPLALLAINLAAAIATNPRINRQPGLLVFHVSLLTLVLLAGIGRLTHLDAHLEIVEGQTFSPSLLMDIRKGPWHVGALDKVVFTQGRYTVDYAPRLKRGLTHSQVFVPQPDGTVRELDVGDDRPLVLERYRFYTTHNKGFAAMLTWLPDDGTPITGVVHMPSYPLFDYKQDNRWTPPDTDEVIKFWLQLDTGLDLEKNWVLDGRNSRGVLVVTSGDRRVELQPGEEVALPHGRLRYDSLTTWMGYRVFYDPTIQWLFFVSVAGVLGLSHFFWKRLNLAAWTDEAVDADSKGENA